MGFKGRGGSGDIGYGMLSKASEKHRMPTAENIGYGKERTESRAVIKGKQGKSVVREISDMKGREPDTKGYYRIRDVIKGRRWKEMEAC